MTSSPRTNVLAYPAFASLKRGPSANNPALVAVRLHFAARNRAGRSLPPPGATCSLPHFRFAQMWPRARTPARVGLRLRFTCGETARTVTGPTFWVCRAKSGAAFRCAPPGRPSASRPWLRRPAPVLCRPRHGSAAPGPQRQKPGPCSRSVAFRLRRNRAGRSLPPLGATCSLPHFRFAQMWPRARTPALVG